VRPVPCVSRPFTRCHHLESKAYAAIGKEIKAAATCANAQSEANLPKRLAHDEPTRQAGAHAVERDDQRDLLRGLLRETFHLCSDLGRLHTVEGVRSDLTLLLSLMEEMEEEKLPKLLQPIRSHMDDIFVPFRQVELMHAALLDLMPEQIVDACVLSWHHDHLSYQSHGKKKQYHRRERHYGLTFSAGLLDGQFEALQVLVFEKLDAIVKASSLVEMVHALIRPSLHSSKGHMTQETFNLSMFSHNHRRYKSGRRQGKAPIELWTGEAWQGDWVELFIQHKREASANANASSSPVLAFVPSHPGQTAPSAIPSDEAVCEPSADADHGWQPTAVAAA